MTLVVGSTGQLGRAIVGHLCDAGKAVRALVRPGAGPDRTEPLRQRGATLVEGDLKDVASLRRACEGVTTVVSTASATISRGAGDSIETVDRDGQLRLVDAAREAGAQRFVYVSFSGNVRDDFPLHAAKRAVEAHLIASGMPYTIVRPSFFMDVWLSPHAGFDPLGGSVRVYGSGDNPVSVIAAADVARYVAGTVDTPAARNQVIELGGPEALSWNAIIDRFERALGRPIARQHVPEAALAAQMASAPDGLQRTLAGLALAVARGDVVDNGPALAIVDIALTPCQAYVDRISSAAR
ncbi:MAG TPA: SDR family oxidoreductase [Vicinamibacterales bacterium]|nr:SDR family oxidoreductase [Vicinamibacterales bacterium]